MGVMPVSRFCIRCGAELPPLPPRPELVEREDERNRNAWKIWLFHIFPGLLSIRVMIVSIACFIAALYCGRIAENAMGGATRMQVLFFMSTGVGAGMACILLYVSGLLLILNGRMGNPLKVLYELDAPRWMAFFIFLLAGPGLYGLSRNALQGIFP